LRQRLSSNEEIDSTTMKEIIIRLMYCEMLGYEVEFGYIHAIKFTSLSGPYEKRLGMRIVMIY
jgi:AP-4 complex subunit epsilon-1